MKAQVTKVVDSASKPSSAPLRFLFAPRKHRKDGLPAISLFSGAGLSDLGYELAGFRFLVHSELEPNRAELCASNFADSTCVLGDLRRTCKEVVSEYRKRIQESPALISVTPPCQGLSSSNPGRGKVADASTSDERNLLLLASLPVIRELQPRVVIVENVPQVLQRMVRVEENEEPSKLAKAFEGDLRPQYRIFSTLTQMANYGVPQDRRRAILVAINVNEPCVGQLEEKGVLPFPRPTHAEVPNDGLLPWVTLEEWLTHMDYPPIDARSSESARCDSDPLHFVPSYEGDRYLMVADIPPRSGQSAYQSSRCHECNCEDVPEGTVMCPNCGALMRNRPYLREKDGTFRLIKGFKSSYRRMRHDRPAATITTASSHLGSDYKIHPWENRVLSIRECADLQTVPRFYDWQWAIETRHTYVVRQVIGEALPPLFTYLHGQGLCTLLRGEADPGQLARDPEAWSDAYLGRMSDDPSSVAPQR